MATFVRSETNPPDLTTYVKIALGAAPNDLTGIFFTSNFNFEMPLNIILYLRGYTTGAPPIDKFWSDPQVPQRLLRQKINSSISNPGAGNTNLVFVAPTLGESSEAGTLVQPGGADKYLDEVVQSIFNFSKRKTTTITPPGGNPLKFDDLGAQSGEDDNPIGGELQEMVYKLILASHSGGGTRMTYIANSLKRYSVSEIWGFDCTYVDGDAPNMAAFATSHPGVKLFYHIIPNSPTSSVATELQKKTSKLRNVSIIPTDPGVVHDFVPIRNLETRIRKSPALH